MADVTVSQFAEVLKVPVEKLIAQLDDAGIKVDGADDTISEDAKLELLTHSASNARAGRLRINRCSTSPHNAAPKVTV